MKNIATIIICIGFLVSSLAAVTSKEEVNWVIFAVGLVASVIGIFIKRRETIKEETVADKLTADKSAIEKNLALLETFAIELDQKKEDMTLDEIREEIEKKAHGPIERFIEARKTLIHIYDLQFYANIMTEFCAGERYLNRCWSASVDGYRNEVHTYLIRVKEQFCAAHARLKT